MTTTKDDPSASASAPAFEQPPPVQSSPTGPSLHARLEETAREAYAWITRHRDQASLLIPATLYLCLVCVLLFDGIGLLVALIAAALLARLGPFISADRMLSLYRAQPIAPRQGTALRAAITLLSERAGLPAQPAIAIVPSMAVGAFSTGTGSRTAIVLTEGLLRRFSLREIVAIAAHEIAHIKSGDLPFFSLADTMTRLAQILAYLGVVLFIVGGTFWLASEPLVNWWTVALLISAPALNSQLQLSLSRQREYDADKLAATLLGDPATIITVALAMEPDFGSPLDDFRLPVPQRRNPIPSPARAHIAGAERADRLHAITPDPLLPPLTITDEPLISLVGVGPIEMRPRDRWPGLWF